MKPSTTSIPALLLATALLSPDLANAAIHLNLDLTGTVSAGAQGTVFPYGDAPSSTSFAGQPMTISLSITNDNGNVYVDGFSASWSNATYSLPFTTGRGGAGVPIDPFNDSFLGFYSFVDLTDSGGAIHILPTPGYIAATDSNFDLNFSYTLNHVHNAFGGFTDGVTGGGAFASYLTFIFDPVIGPYDANSTGSFTLGGITQTSSVPEPAVWATLVLGFAAIGAAVRAGRRARCRPA